MRPRQRPSLLALAAIATVLGASSSLQAYWLALVTDKSVPMVTHLVVLNLVYWYVPALLAPIILRVATAYPVGNERWRTRLLIHIGGALAYSVVHTAAMLTTRYVLMPQAPERGWWFAARVEYLTQLDWMFMTYLFLVGLAHALAYRRESDRRALDSAHLETRLVEAQLQALQRQLRPHFLFNTLNAIAGLMRTDVDAADRMMDRLGDLLRMTLHTSNIQEVSLKDELDMLQKYLDIEQVRFGQRLSVTIMMGPGTRDALVPNFLLQPLVENAVRHGIAPFARPGRLAIEAARDDSKLTIRIVDSGDGVPPHRLTLLNQGVGLSNTRARLEHLYRRDHALVFSNVKDGFEVTVSVPFALQGVAVETVRQGAA